MNAAPSPIDIPVRRSAIIDSTSLHARRLFERGELPDTPVIFVADEQTGGRGRMGRPWQSPRGGLWCTLAWPPASGSDVERTIEGLGIRVGVAALRVIKDSLGEAACPSAVQLKWPNDIFIDGKKVCGVLCELLRHSAPDREHLCLLIGVGINANLRLESLDTELRGRATTLLEHTKAPIDLESLRSRLTRELMTALHAQGLPAPILDEARRHLFGLGQPSTISLPDGGVLRGTLSGLDEQGLAVLRTDQGTIHAPQGALLLAG